MLLQSSLLVVNIYLKKKKPTTRYWEGVVTFKKKESLHNLSYKQIGQ